MKTVSAKAVTVAVKELNARPLKTLVFRTPADLIRRRIKDTLLFLPFYKDDELQLLNEINAHQKFKK